MSPLSSPVSLVREERGLSEVGGRMYASKEGRFYCYISGERVEGDWWWYSKVAGVTECWSGHPLTVLKEETPWGIQVLNPMWPCLSRLLSDVAGVPFRGPRTWCLDLITWELGRISQTGLAFVSQREAWAQMLASMCFTVFPEGG